MYKKLSQKKRNVQKFALGSEQIEIVFVGVSLDQFISYLNIRDGNQRFRRDFETFRTPFFQGFFQSSLMKF